jgi:L-fuconolactonase
MAQFDSGSASGNLNHISSKASLSERIDAHHHLWKYSHEEYPWMLHGMECIRRDFLIDELCQAMRDASIQGLVTVQARQKIVETEWLLALAAEHDFMRAIVGWVPLIDPAVESILEKHASNPKLKAVRHVLHDEPDDFYMLRPDFNAGISLLEKFGLRYDILIFERHVPQTIDFVDRHPNQIFILDHMAKPRIKDDLLCPWREHIRHLAQRENVFCKVSGMVTEADWKNWTEGDLRPYFDSVLTAFGPKRLMFGSDWPVILVACGYHRWAEIVRSWIAEMSPDEQAAILGDTAKVAYSL